MFFDYIHFFSVFAQLFFIPGLFSALFFTALPFINDFVLGTKGLTHDESAVVVTTADGGNVVAVSLFFSDFC